MSSLLRGTLAGAGFVLAFAGGYFAHYLPSVIKVSAEPKPAPAVAAERPKFASAVTETPSRPTVAGTPVPVVERPVREPKIKLPPIPSIEPPDFEAVANRSSMPPTPPLPPVPILDFEPKTISGPRLDKVDPADPAFQMIKKEMGIKTTILGHPEPVPEVLADAQKAGMDPSPMIGPTPRLEASPGISKVTPLIYQAHRDIALDFEVTRIGASSVRAVELWTTRDNGATWQRTDRIEGNRPPFRTRLGSEGEYGFRLVFENESGMRTSEPKTGSSADLRVLLDTTPPTINLLAPVEVGKPGSIQIRWNVSDAHLVDVAGLRIEYSEDGRQWHLITKEVNATAASFDWKIPQGVAPKVLLRVTASDLAGNIGTAESAEKVSIDLVVPEGRIKGLWHDCDGPEIGPIPRVVATR